MKIEVCVNSIETAKIAAELGVDRIELCSAPIVGGLTPNYGLMEACVEETDLSVNVMIRHNEGDFVCSDADIDIMLKDIEMAKVAGAHGVVFGCLTEFNEINLDQNELLISKAQDLDLQVTFHRAFDFLEDPYQGLEILIDLGFDRVLTSGLSPSAYEGRATIKQLVKFANQRTGIVAGAGINAENVKALAQTGIEGVHFTAHRSVTEVALGMGAKIEPDVLKIQTIIGALR